jgi:hypothetical protein
MVFTLKYRDLKVVGVKYVTVQNCSLFRVEYFKRPQSLAHRDAKQISEVSRYESQSGLTFYSTYVCHFHIKIFMRVNCLAHQMDFVFNTTKAIVDIVSLYNLLILNTF